MKRGAPVGRCLRIYEALAAHVVDGLTNKAVADATQSTPVNACRDLAVLEECGWVARLPNGRWVLTTKPLALLKAYELSYGEMLARAEEARTSITAAALRYGRG